jgi:hypothetical protein
MVFVSYGRFNIVTVYYGLEKKYIFLEILNACFIFPLGFSLKLLIN